MRGPCQGVLQIKQASAESHLNFHYPKAQDAECYGVAVYEASPHSKMHQQNGSSFATLQPARKYLL